MPAIRSSRSGLEPTSAGLGPHRAQVRVEAHPLAQAEQALLGAGRVGVGRVPLRAADRAEQDRVGGAAGLEHLVGERRCRGRRSRRRPAAARRTRTRRARRAAAAPRRRSRGRSRRRAGRLCAGRSLTRADSSVRLGSGRDGLDVEPHVVERQRARLGRRAPRRRRAPAAPRAAGPDAGRGTTVRSELGGSRAVDRLGSQPAARLVEPGSSGALRLLGARRSSRARDAPRSAARRARAPATSSAIACAARRRCRPAALRRQAATGPQRRAQASKSASWSRIQWKIAVEKTASTGSASSSSSRSATSSLVRGRRRRSLCLARSSTASRRPRSPVRGQPLEQQRGDAAAAAAGVEHRLVALQLEPLEDLPRPLLLGIGDAVIGRGVPVARSRGSPSERRGDRAAIGRAGRPRRRRSPRRSRA